MRSEFLKHLPWTYPTPDQFEELLELQGQHQDHAERKREDSVSILKSSFSTTDNDNWLYIYILHCMGHEFKYFKTGN